MTHISQMINQNINYSKAFAVYCTMDDKEKQEFDDYLKTPFHPIEYLPAVAISIKTGQPYTELDNYKEIEAGYKDILDEYLYNVPMQADDIEVKNAIHILFNEYGLIKVDNRTPFLEGSVDDADTLPIQGWKFHIATDDIRDYYEIVKKAIPEFIENHFVFKVVEPFVYNNENTSNLYGKDITLYPNEQFTMQKLSPEVRKLLDKETEKIAASDIPIQGKIKGRFGSFFYLKLINRCGSVVKDNRIQAGSDILSSIDCKPEEIINFQEDIKKRYELHHDQRRYVQEYMLGMKFNANEKYLFFDYMFDKNTDLSGLKDHLRQNIYNNHNIDEYFFLDVVDKQILLVPINSNSSCCVMYETESYCRENNIAYEDIPSNDSIGHSMHSLDYELLRATYDEDELYEYQTESGEQDEYREYEECEEYEGYETSKSEVMPQGVEDDTVR